jgi:hypothetical protein
MSFIDCDERWFTPREHLKKSGNGETFGRDEEEIKMPFEVFRANFARRFTVATGMNAFRFEPKGPKL